HRGERIAAMGRDAGEERQRLTGHVAPGGFARVAARRSNRESDKAPLRQLVSKVTIPVGTQSDARFRLVVRNEHGEEWSFALRDEQETFRGLTRGNLNSH